MGKDALSPEEIRDVIRHRIEEKGLDMKALSLELGRAHSYLQQYLNRGIPRFLKEGDRANLAELLDLDEVEIGGPTGKASTQKALPEYYLVPEYDVHVSAGGGSEVGYENVISQWPFNPSYISNYLGLGHVQLVLVEVRGDSMEPTLESGDRVLVNTSDRQVSQPGIFVLWDGGGTVIKRVEKRVGVKDSITLISDNPRHSTYDVDVETLNVVGRVVWVARRL